MTTAEQGQADTPTDGDPHETQMPAALADFAERVLGPTRAVADHSWPYPGSEVHRVQTPDGTKYIVKQLQNRRFFGRELTGYSWTPALGPGRAPTLVAADPDIRAVILSILPGLMLKPDAGLASEDEPDAFEQAGALLARLHRAVEPRYDTSTIDRLVARTDDHVRRAGAELNAAQYDLVYAQAETLQSIAPRLISVASHGDYQRRNLLWQPGARTLGVIDFERAELAPAVRDFVLLESDAFLDRPDLKTAFVRGYGRELDPLETRALGAWIILDAVSALAWGSENRQQGLIDRARRTFSTFEPASRFSAPAGRTET